MIHTHDFKDIIKPSENKQVPIPCHFCGQPAGYEDGQALFWESKGFEDENWVRVFIHHDVELYSLQVGPFGNMFICNDPECSKKQDEFNKTEDVRFLTAFEFASMISYTMGKGPDESYYRMEKKCDDIIKKHGGGASLIYPDYYLKEKEKYDIEFASKGYKLMEKCKDRVLTPIGTDLNSYGTISGGGFNPNPKGTLTKSTTQLSMDGSMDKNNGKKKKGHPKWEPWR